MTRFDRWTVAIAVAAFVTIAGAALAAESKAALDRGKYLVTVMTCADCLTPGGLVGKHDWPRAMAGSDIAFFIPELGYFFPPNLTPDPETGLGKWSKADIVKAITTGFRPDGRGLVPIMPWKFYASLTKADAEAIAAYLKSLAPITNPVPPPTGEGEKPPGPYMTVAVPKQQ